MLRLAIAAVILTGLVMTLRGPTKPCGLVYAVDRLMPGASVCMQAWHRPPSA